MSESDQQTVDLLDLDEAPADFTEHTATDRHGRRVRMHLFKPEVFRSLPQTYFIEIDGKLVASSDTWPEACFAFRAFLGI